MLYIYFFLSSCYCVCHEYECCLNVGCIKSHVLLLLLLLLFMRWRWKWIWWRWWCWFTSFFKKKNSTYRFSLALYCSVFSAGASGVKIISNILFKEKNTVFPEMNGTMLIDLYCVGWEYWDIRALPLYFHLKIHISSFWKPDFIIWWFLLKQTEKKMFLSCLSTHCK